MHRSISLGSVLLALSLSGCASTSSRPARSTVGGDAIAVTMSSNGSHVQLETGQLLWVELPENAGSGLTWQIASPLNQAVLRPDGTHFVEPDAASDSNTGKQQLRFKAVAPGEVVLDLALVHPGRGLRGAADRWIVQVVVR